MWKFQFNLKLFFLLSSFVPFYQQGNIGHRYRFTPSRHWSMSTEKHRQCHWGRASFKHFRRHWQMQTKNDGGALNFEPENIPRYFRKLNIDLTWRLWQYYYFSFAQQCVSMPGLGFRRGSYKCICRRGFYYPDVKSVFKYYNGSTLEEEYAKVMQVSNVACLYSFHFLS